MGLYEYIDNSALCLMEWSEKIDELLQNENKVTIHKYIYSRYLYLKQYDKIYVFALRRAP